METKKIDSALQDEKVCLICGTANNIHRHHVFGGVARRKLSEKYKLVVYLCANHHNMGSDSVHMKPKGIYNTMIRQKAQEYYEEHYGSREDFIRDFGRNYL